MVSTEVPMKYRSSTTVLAHLVPTVGQPYKGAQVGTRVLLCCGTSWRWLPLPAWQASNPRTGLLIRWGPETLGILAVSTASVPAVYPLEAHV